jgi:hypothetical protein
VPKTLGELPGGCNDVGAWAGGEQLKDDISTGDSREPPVHNCHIIATALDVLDGFAASSKHINAVPKAAEILSEDRSDRDFIFYNDDVHKDLIWEKDNMVIVAQNLDPPQSCFSVCFVKRVRDLPRSAVQDGFEVVRPVCIMGTIQQLRNGSGQVVLAMGGSTAGQHRNIRTGLDFDAGIVVWKVLPRP